MKTILVPTDYSENAENALTYACEINKQLNYKILLFHSYHIPIPVSDIPVVPVSEAEVRRNSVNALNAIKKNMEKSYAGMEFNVLANMGLADDEIVNEAKNLKCELIVMGTHGKSGLGDYIMGTNTATVIGNAPCPVLAVPEKVAFKGIHKIVFAADYGTHNFDNALHVVNLARHFDSELILLHITKGKMDENFEYAELEAFKHRLSEQSGYPKISFKLLEDTDIYHGLNIYLDEINADMLAISMRNRNFFQKIFDRSLTKKMIYHSHLPTLVFHAHA